MTPHRRFGVVEQGHRHLADIVQRAADREGIEERPA
jgi:hypothetical protein